MKNHIAVKFIAIVLCAASLMGAIGGIAGVVVMTEGDLYNKTAEQVRDERIQQDVEAYANSLARMYASAELGACPESMVRSTSDQLYWFENAYRNYGYTILDADGKTVSSYNSDLTGDVQSYTVSSSGQYMHLVSLEAQSEIDARESEARALQQAERYRSLLTDANGNTVPEEGISIDEVMFLHIDGGPIYQASHDGNGHTDTMYFDEDGDGFGWGFETERTGYLFYTPDGHLVYNSYLDDGNDDLGYVTVGEVLFYNHDEGFYFTMADYENGLGTLSNQGGRLQFISSFTAIPEEAAAAEETTPEETLGWTVETIPDSEDTVLLIAPDGTSVTVNIAASQEEQAPAETTAETIPEENTEAVAETAVEETAAAETEMVEETVPSSASALPEETTAPAMEETAPVETAAQTIPQETIVEETVAEETVPAVTEPVLINGKTLDNYQVNTQVYYDQETGEQMIAKYVYVPMPELTVEMFIDQNTVRDNALYDMMALIRQFHNYLLPVIGICLLVFAILVVYLCTAAGRSPKTEEVRAGGLNRMPLDLYLLGGGFAIACIVAVGVESTENLLYNNIALGCGFAVGATFLACLIFVGFCFAFVAQIKTPGGFWWKNTLCGIGIWAFMRFGVWFENFMSVKGCPWLVKMVKKLWKYLCKGAAWLYHVWEKAANWIIQKVHRFFSLLPLTWQWMAAGFLIIFVLIICIDAFKDGNDVFLPIGIIFTIAVVLYASHCFGILSESTKRMSKGDLDTKVDDKLMAGCFKEFAGDLNDLADVAVVAAQNQLKSERMKTELITNVSHDIKTPLTSIINYVDLLQKPHTEEEEAQYLEVLDRQSQRLKKLIDDLMDMSKASTGNMPVDITQVDAVESVNQALGEFADKLDKAQLIPVFRHDDAQVPMMADGKLVWRVMSNLLTNAVKYAMPGTRLYIDLMTLEGKVILSMKNISREELNVDADELMERFVRGDDSRNTEGSGLGLNIAKSLMELQKGQLQILVDGDLFKVTLIFPGA